MRTLGPSRHPFRTSAAAALLLLAGSGILHGCRSAAAPEPKIPGGGTSLPLSYPLFVSAVEPVLTRQGCDAGGDCHGGGIMGTFALSPESAKDSQFDFQQVSLQVSATQPDSSPILTRPLALAAGGVPHPYKPFASVADSDYQAIHGWIWQAVPRP